MDTIGQKIRKLRKAHGLSQEKLALELYVSRQTINKWENEEGLPNTESIRLLCEFFKVDSNYLLNNEALNASGETAAANNDTPEEAAIPQPPENKKRKRIKITCIVFACIFLLLFAVAMFFTVWSGLIIFTPNKGYIGTSTNDIKKPIFGWMIIFDIILILLSTLMVVIAKKLRM